MKDWLKTFATVGKENGYTAEQIAEYKLYLNLCKAWQAHFCKKKT